MTPMTISAHVVNGKILPEQSVAALEGQRVIATLTVVAKEPANGKAVAISPVAMDSHAPLKEAAATADDVDPEPPEWLDVENDVYFPMTRPEIRLGKKKIRVERGEPCIILPEELPDD